MMKLIGLLALTGIFALTTFASDVSAQSRRALNETLNLTTLKRVPKDFIGTPQAAAFETIIAFNEIQDSIERFENKASFNRQDQEFAVHMIGRPCSIYEHVHDVAYEAGAVYARYPKANLADRASAADKYYAQAFSYAEEIMGAVNDLAVSNRCAVVPNSKCCNNSGALDKCDPSTKFCEITGSVDNCTSTSNNC